MRVARCHRALVTLLLASAALSACSSTATGSGTPEASTATLMAATPTLEVPASPSPTPRTEPSLAAGWRRIAPADAPFSIGLPPGWTDASTSTASSALDAIASANPDLAAAIANGRKSIEAGQLAFVAFDVGGGTGNAAAPFVTNANVMSIGPAEGGGLYIASQLAESLRQQMKVGEIETSTVLVDGTEAGAISYSWTITAPNGEAIDLAAVQYGIPDDQTAFVVTFTTLAQDLAQKRVVFSHIMDTFHIER
jgi:hypothetical protein